MSSRFATLMATLAVVVFGLGLIWLIGVKDATRYWGLLALLVAVGVFAWSARPRQRS